MDFDKLWNDLESSLVSRRWDVVCSSWRSHTPKIDPPGSAPCFTVTRYLDESGLFAELMPKKHGLTHIRNSREEVPSLVLREAIFWLHKAVHVLGVCESQVDLGRLTWSSSDAYQATYFAARAITSFMGVAIAEVGNSSVVVELCRDQRGLRPGKIAEIGAFEDEIHILSLGVLFDHRQIWSIFKRIIRTTTRLTWPDDLATYFCNIDVATLSRQRHRLHYQVDYWIMPDMHEFIHSDSFRDVSPDSCGRALYSSDRVNYTFSIAYSLAQLALQMFRDICSMTNRLSAELSLLKQTLSPERHPMFSNTLREKL